VFILHYLIAGMGLVLTGLICDKFICLAQGRRLLAAALAAIGGFLTVLLLFTSDPVLHFVLFLTATFSGFGANAVLLGGLLLRIPPSLRPMGFGLAFAAAVLLRLPIDLYAANGGAGTYLAYILVAAAALLVLALLLSLALLLRTKWEAAGSHGEAYTNTNRNSRLLWMAVACGVAVYVLFGIFDHLASGSPFLENRILYIRLAQIISSVAVGIICLRFGYYAAVISSISFLGAGTLAHLFAWNGLAWLICALATVTGFVLFNFPLRSLFSEIATHSKYPYTVASFGFALYFMTQIIGIPIAGLMKNMDKESGMALYAVLFMVVVPLIMLFFYELRSSHAAKENAATDGAGKGILPDQRDMWTKYDLSRREKEVLGFVLQGLLSREIAELLFVSESTINWHVSNILNKTGAGNRARLIELNRGGESFL
jgi:DNA-binding CsgD family transcriptional regulator